MYIIYNHSFNANLQVPLQCQSTHLVNAKRPLLECFPYELFEGLAKLEVLVPDLLPSTYLGQVESLVDDVHGPVDPSFQSSSPGGSPGELGLGWCQIWGFRVELFFNEV